MKVAICGASGGIGQPLSLLFKQNLPSGTTLALYDVVPAIKGVAVDLSHISTHVKLEYYQGDPKNPTNPEVDKALKDTDLVVIPAGVPRKPGMTRDDLFNINAGILKGLIEAIARNSPKAIIAIITNPVNSIVPIAVETLKQHGVYDPRKVFGISTLDVVRAQTFIGELKGIDPLQVHIDVIGGHSPETMVPILSQVKGVTFTEDEIKSLTTQIKEAGTVVVNAKEGAGSATLSMAYAGFRFGMSLVRALQGQTGIVECTYVPTDKVETGYFALPVELGKEGIVKIHDVPTNVSEYEQAQLKECIATLHKNVESGVKFVKA
jgi:NAD-dependent malate dehydrogenase